MQDFEKPITTTEGVGEDGEKIPTAEEITELEAETNELAQEAISLTKELNAVVDNPETTEEQLSYLERKVGELKEFWDDLDKTQLFLETGAAALSMSAIMMSSNSFAEALNGPTKDISMELGACLGSTLLGVFFVGPYISHLYDRIKEVKSRIVK